MVSKGYHVDPSGSQFPYSSKYSILGAFRGDMSSRVPAFFFLPDICGPRVGGSAQRSTQLLLPTASTPLTSEINALVCLVIDIDIRVYYIRVGETRNELMSQVLTLL
jgi:hypothetical protein